MGAIISRARSCVSRAGQKQRKSNAWMGAIIYHIRCFISGPGKMLWKIMKWGAGVVIVSIVLGLLIVPVENPTKIKEDESSLEQVHPEEPPIAIENVDRREEQVIKETLVEKPERWINQYIIKETLVEKPERWINQYIIKETLVEKPEKWINQYSSCQMILLVGEGDFSFSASLAMAFGSASNMIATSLDSIEFLANNYRRAISNIMELSSRGCRVYHGVDATEMANHPLLKAKKFDRIIYNFPFAGFFRTESPEFQISQHRQLVSLFLKNAREMIKETGEIHITHKTNGFHRKWEIERLASSQGLLLIEAERFDIKSYPGYCTKYGFGGDKDFDCNPSKTYKFGLGSASTKKRKMKTSDTI